MVDKLYFYLFIFAIVVLTILITLAIIKSIIGPKVADRIIAINVISTLVVMILCILSVLFSGEGFIADIPIVYVLVSFVALIVLANVYIRVNLRKKIKNDKEEEK